MCIRDRLYTLLKRLEEQPVSVAQESVSRPESARTPAMQAEEEKQIASGVETITVDIRSKNKVYYSDELVHGLGAGDVFLSAGIHESVHDDQTFDENKIYFGNTSIFEGGAYQSGLPKMEKMCIRDSRTPDGTISPNQESILWYVWEARITSSGFLWKERFLNWKCSDRRDIG